jgi:lysozyme
MSLKSSLKKHEGLRLKPYRCTAGKLSIGYGRNLDDVGITKEEAEILLDKDIAVCKREARRFGWFEELSSERQDVIVEMIFNLGMSRFLGFKKTIQAIMDKDFEEAAAQMLDSKWARQVGQRAITLSSKMLLDNKTKEITK